MPTTDTTEKGLEALIEACLLTEAGYLKGNPKDYDPDTALDLAHLGAFLQETQPEVFEGVGFNTDGPPRRQFLDRLRSEVAKHGVIHVLRHGIKHQRHSVSLFYGSPSAGNPKAQSLYQANRFSVTRQLHYSKDAARRSLDMAVFINGLPVATFELKNSLTKQTVEDAVRQYKTDRDPRELLFQKFRCAVHFAVDDAEVRMCAELKGPDSWFLPFNKGYNDGAGNPPNPHGLKTDYLWREVLTKDSLTNILENFAQVVTERDENNRTKQKQLFPRYHQLDVVRRLLADVAERGCGHRYLIQHSAGSGKSNSIAWLAHQLIDVEHAGRRVFDSVVVVTDRTVLDRQIRDSVRQFADVGSIVGHAERSGDLRRFLTQGKKIIITTVQKFPFVLDEIGDTHRGGQFAILIDEAHSSQGGRTAAKMNMALSAANTAAPGTETGDDDEETTEDKINRIMASRKLVPNASYFAFTATPKHKTLEMFGQRVPQPNGEAKFRPFHSYTMKQAIQEGFILDVLKHYTPVASYYKLIKQVEDDPQFDTKRARKKLRHYVESNQYPIRQKAEMMVDHFLEQVAGKQKIGGQARAMVVASGIHRAIDYFLAFRAYLKEIRSPYVPIVAFSGEHDVAGERVTEATLNGFPSNQIPATLKRDPYRFLIVADKYQTGFDEPLLHTMYVDKALEGIKAVQTLSRLNRAHPKKHDTFVLDFVNDADTIQEAFSTFYRTTLLSRETDPNKLHDLKADLDGARVYFTNQVEAVVQRYLEGATREKLDPVLDACVGVYLEDLDEAGQVDFKSKAKAFIRTYGFLASILPYSDAGWEKLSIFLNMLVPKLPAPQEEDLSRGILEAIDMDSYRVEMLSTLAITLSDQETEIDPIPTATGGAKAEPKLDFLSNILRTFNDQFGNIDWNDEDKIRQVIAEELPTRVASDRAYQNAMKNSDKQNARIEHDRALKEVLLGLLADHTELFKQYSDNPSFKKFLEETIFNATYTPTP